MSNYFAYGSNMLLERLRERVPSASLITAAKLPGHALKFHKRSVDGSGKCNAFETGNPEDEIYGVIFQIDKAEKPALDRAEGLGRGYSQKEVKLIDLDGDLTAYTYVADADYIDDSLRPYGWYRDFVVEGAKQNLLPSDYIHQLESLPVWKDPNLDGAKRNRRILEGL